MSKLFHQAGEFWAHPDVTTYTQHRLLLELDRATEDHPRFGREKVRSGVVYLRSEAYRRWSGYRTGRWVVVTTSQRRMQRMKEQAEREVGKDARVFWFTPFDREKPLTVLTTPIWYRGGDARPLTLLQVQGAGYSKTAITCCSIFPTFPTKRYGAAPRWGGQRAGAARGAALIAQMMRRLKAP